MTARVVRVVEARAPGFSKSSRRRKAALVDVPGVGKVWAEPPDTDDTFPPAIASYEMVAGWLVYHGRDGSVGVVVGPRADLIKWMAEVDKLAGAHPEPEARPWRPSDGGATNIRKAEEAARKVYPRIVVEFFVEDGDRVSGEHTYRAARVVNAHLDVTSEVGGKTVHAGSKTAAHEAAHQAYSAHPELGRAATDALKRWGRSVSLYHSIAGDFEGTIEAGAWWALDPRGMEQKAPELYAAVSSWLGSVR